MAESADSLLPTIVSRCQRIDLADAGRRGLPENLAARVDGIVDGAADSFVGRACAAARLALVLQELKGEIERAAAAEVKASSKGPGVEIDEDGENALVSARYRAVRRDFMVTLMEYFRRVMSRAATEKPAPIPLADAFQNLQLVEQAAKRLDLRNMQEIPVLGQLFDQLSFPRK